MLRFGTRLSRKSTYSSPATHPHIDPIQMHAHIHTLKTTVFYFKLLKPAKWNPLGALLVYLHFWVCVCRCVCLCMCAYGWMRGWVMWEIHSTVWGVYLCCGFLVHGLHHLQARSTYCTSHVLKKYWHILSDQLHIFSFSCFVTGSNMHCLSV